MNRNEYIKGNKIIIPYGVVEIEDELFKDCSQVTEIELPRSVKKIGDRAFLHCSSLTSIKIPNSVTSIGADAFIFVFRSVEQPKITRNIQA